MNRKKLVRKAEQSPRQGKVWPRWTGLQGKTVWDWLQLLIVPVLVGILAVILTAWFNNQQSERQQRIEDQRAKSERKIQQENAQDEALQAYLSQMGKLLLEKDLWDSDKDSEVRALARARTLTTLQSIDPQRKPLLIQFLYESDLIYRDHRVIGLEDANLTDTDFTETNPDEPRLNKVYLTGADFDGANMAGSRLNDAELRGVHMIGTHLEEAELRNAFLQEADLSHAFLGSTESTYTPGDRFVPLKAADLRGVNLSHATLRDAFMFGVDMSPNKWGPPTSKYPKKYRGSDPTELIDANLHKATLWQADLSGAVLDDADFSDAVLRGATLNRVGVTGLQHRVNFTGAKLDYANFTLAALPNANFSNVTGKVEKSAIANFTRARLDGANFTDATLDGADFTGARLDYAKFTDAQGITPEQLEKQAESLKSATMPNGQMYEEWLNDKGGHR